MKFTVIVLIIAVYAVVSCSSDEQKSDPCPEKWQLVSMLGNIGNIPLKTGANMDWQEWYLLYPNNTFTKTRTLQDVTKEQGGTYAFVTIQDEDFIELTYSAENELIGNCEEAPKELLRIISGEEIVSTWLACDGPGLSYNKVGYECGAK
jgi:hypothetical protein